MLIHRPWSIGIAQERAGCSRITTINDIIEEGVISEVYVTPSDFETRSDTTLVDPVPCNRVIIGIRIQSTIVTKRIHCRDPFLCQEECGVLLSCILCALQSLCRDGKWSDDRDHQDRYCHQHFNERISFCVFGIHTLIYQEVVVLPSPGYQTPLATHHPPPPLLQGRSLP